MSENQPSESDRQQRLAELQARLQKLTEERKAELRRSGPLPGDESPRSADEDAAVEAVAPAAPEAETVPAEPVAEATPAAASPPASDPLPVLETPPLLEVSTDQPAPTATTPPDPERPSWLSSMRPAEATPPAGAAPAASKPPAHVTPQAAETPPGEAAPPAEMTAPEPNARRASAAKAATSAASAATSALVGRIATVAGGTKRIAAGVGRQATARARALTARTGERSPRPPGDLSRPPGDLPRPDGPVASEETAERRVKKRRSLRAAILVGLGLIGGAVLMQFGGRDLLRIVDGALPAAETNEAGSPSATGARPAGSPEAARPAGSLEAARPAASRMDAGPARSGVDAGSAAGNPVANGSADDDGLAPVETAPASVRPAPPELEITRPTAPDVAPLDEKLALIEPAASLPTPSVGSSSPPVAGNATDRPTFIPYDVPPKLENPREIQRLLEQLYPSQLRDAGVDGTVILWIFVDEQGVVQKTEVKESSGYEVMDEAALSTAEKMRFAPAMNRDKPTPVWLSQPITFRS